MTFDPFDDSVWVPDHADWLAYNKKHLSARKIEWSQILPSLKEVARIKRNPAGYLSAHKSLFFKGVLTEECKYQIANHRNLSSQGGEQLFFCFPLFYLWYHPELSAQVVEDTLARFTSIPLAKRINNEMSAMALKVAISTLYQLQGLRRPYDDYGIMGGREQTIAPYLLLGSSTGTSKDSFRVGWFNTSCRTLLDQMVPGMTVLDGKRKQPKLGMKYIYNPRGTGQYVWPQVSHYIQRHFVDQIQHPEDHNLGVSLSVIDFWIQRVLFHGEYPGTQHKDPLAIECRDRILNQYRNGELAEWLSERFAMREKLGMEIV